MSQSYFHVWGYSLPGTNASLYTLGEIEQAAYIRMYLCYDYEVAEGGAQFNIIIIVIMCHYTSLSRNNSLNNNYYTIAIGCTLMRWHNSRGAECASNCLKVCRN